MIMFSDKKQGVPYLSVQKQKVINIYSIGGGR